MVVIVAAAAVVVVELIAARLTASPPCNQPKSRQNRTSRARLYVIVCFASRRKREGEQETGEKDKVVISSPIFRAPLAIKRLHFSSF